MAGSPAGVRARHLISLAQQIGFPVTPAMLARWHRDGLLPLPTVLSLGRGRGTETIYPEGTENQFLALCESRKKTRSLDRIAWALWWKGFTLTEQRIRPALDELLDDLQDLEGFALRLGEDDGSAPDEVYDAAWDRFERLVHRSRRRVAARLAHKFGFADWRELLRVGLRVVTGTFVGAAELPSDAIAPVVSVVPGIAWSRSMLVAAFQELSPGLRILSLRTALTNASLDELDVARDELRTIAFMFDGSVTCMFRKVFGAKMVDRRFGSLLDDDSVLQRYLFLLWLAHRRNPTVRLGIRGLAVELGRPEVKAWLASP